MPLPASAQRQIKEANRLQAAVIAGEPTGAPAGDQPVVQPASTAQPVTEPDALTQLHHKFNVLQGKYNAETARLMGAAQALAAENEAQRALLARPAATPAATPRPEERFDTSMVTAKEREEFGEELVEMMARIAKANSGAEVARLTKELNAMRGQVQETVQVGQQTRMEKVWQALDAQLPQWRILNDSQQFLDWLQIPDIMSGRPRQEGLNSAFNAGDSARVVGIFKRFAEEDALARPTSQEQQQPNAALLNRETLVAPNRGGSATVAPNGTNGRIYSEQDIDDFYSRVQRGRISPEEKKATELDLQNAVREGRVVPRRDDRHLANSR